MVYSGYTGTLVTVGITAQSLLALIRVNRPNCPAACRALQFQTPGTNPGSVYFGESAVSATDYGYEMPLGDTKNYPNDGAVTIPLAAIFVIGSVADCDLAVEVIW